MKTKLYYYMKRLIFAMAIVAVGITCTAQTASRMFDVGDKWYYGSLLYTNGERVDLFTEEYTVKEKREKNGKSYAVVSFVRYEFDNSYWDSDIGEPPMAGTEVCVREKDGRVYVDREDYLALLGSGSYWSHVGNADYIPYPVTDDGKELVLYDFTMKKGDKLPSCGGHTDISVTKVEEVLTADSVLRRKFTYSNGAEAIEGMGSTLASGLFFFYLNPTTLSQNTTSRVTSFSKGWGKLLPITSKAQEVNMAFLTEGKVWTMLYKKTVGAEGDTEQYVVEKIKLGGDVVTKSDIPFKRIYTKTWLREKEVEPDEWTDGKGYLGEKDEKVYILWDDAEKPVCVMDFTLGGGDYMNETNQNEACEVQTIDTLYASSVSKGSQRYLYVTDTSGDNGKADTWIEGVGSTTYGLLGVQGFSTSTGFSRLLKCEENGVRIYEASDTPTGIAGVQKNSSHMNGKRYDLSGRRVTPSSKTGVYVVDGRKRIVSRRNR